MHASKSEAESSSRSNAATTHSSARATVEEIEEANIVGILTKRGYGFPYTWQKRYCLFNAQTKTLVYYIGESDMAKGRQPRGDKAGVTGISHLDSEPFGLSFSLAGGPPLLARAENAEEQERWLSIVGRCFELPAPAAAPAEVPPLRAVPNSSSTLGPAGSLRWEFTAGGRFKPDDPHELHNWYPSVAPLTFPSAWFDATKEEATALTLLYRHHQQLRWLQRNMPKDESPGSDYARVAAADPWLELSAPRRATLEGLAPHVTRTMPLAVSHGRTRAWRRDRPRASTPTSRRCRAAPSTALSSG
jgi:hypothetical protein